MRTSSFRAIALASVLLVVVPVRAQEADAPRRSIEAQPERLTLSIGDTLAIGDGLEARVVGPDGGAIEDARLLLYSLDRRAVEVTAEGQVVAHAPGTTALVWAHPIDGGRVTREVTAEVAHPPLAAVAFREAPARVYAGTQVGLEAVATSTRGTPRDDLAVAFESSDPAVASVDAHGLLHAHKAGTVTLTARAQRRSAQAQVEVVPNPTVRLVLEGGKEEVATGEVLHFEAVAYDAEGAPVEDVPVTYAVAHPATQNEVAGTMEAGVTASASGQVDGEGRFVAARPGRYTVIATTGDHAAQRTVRAVPRADDVTVEVVGRGTVSDVHTSDLWVWEGDDGRDYAITGTWGGDGETYFWDVTDPTQPAVIDTVTVDARTVNDVKVSEDGQVCVVSREGASNRRNGIVVLDCSDPSDVRILSEYTDGLTGGVHNVFVYDGHVYAVNNGRRFDVIDIQDPTQPHRVGRFELDTPGHAIHDVWVQDGIAYSSNWNDGVVLVDVGGGDAGGSPSNPVQVGQYTYPSGWNHAAFPYRDPVTGAFYVIAGDEAFPNGLNIGAPVSEDLPTRPAGWIHFVDFDDRDAPREVARYAVPEAGTHNFWVDEENDLLYVAYYNAGLRVVDISGELMGNLYDQGREVARVYTDDPDGKIPNAPMAWGPQPHKGHVFVSDWNSGLWVVKVEKEDRVAL